MLWSIFLPAAIAIAAGFWLIRWAAYGKPSVRTPADLAVLLLVMIFPVTLKVTILPEVSRIQVMRLLTGIALFYAIANWGNSITRLRLLLAGSAIVGISLALSAPFSVEWVTDKLVFIPGSLYQQLPLILSDSIHPNVLAGNLVILLPIPLAFLLFNWEESKPPERLLYSLTSISLFAIIILTRSRGAWLALACSLIFFTIARFRWGWLLVIIILVIIIVTAWRVDLTRMLNFILTSQSIGGMALRINIWNRAIHIIRDFPFTGIGMGLFNEAISTLYPINLTNPAYHHAHNLFLQIGIDLGLIGLIAWTAIFLTITITSWQVLQIGRLQTNPLAIALGVGSIGSQIALVVHGLVDSVTWGMVRPVPLVWALWGLAVVGWYTQTTNTKKASSLP